jgi:hypothetical protein
MNNFASVSGQLPYICRSAHVRLLTESPDKIPSQIKEPIMQSRVVALCVLAVCLAACGVKDQADSASDAELPSLSALPTTVEGFLEVSVAEGDVEDDDISEFNFGTITVDGKEIPFECDGALLRSAAVPETGANVRATLGSSVDYGGVTTYKITALDRL